MKLNKNGLTIIELIVSIALISMVMLFIYRLLGDITFEKENDYIATANQRQRIEIIDYIESEFENYEITMDYGILSSNKLQIDNHIFVSVETSKITVYSLTNASKVRTWEIKGGTLGTISCEEKGLTSKNLIECHIPVYTTNVNNKKNGSIDNNNTLDDIFFSFTY